MTVADDGIGFSAGETEGAGIRGMRERAFAIDSTLAIATAHGAGTSLVLDVPLPATRP